MDRRKIKLYRTKMLLNTLVLCLSTIGCTKISPQIKRYPLINEWVECQDVNDSIQWKILFRINGTYDILREKDEDVVWEKGNYRMDGENFILLPNNYGIENPLIDYEISFEEKKEIISLFIFDKRCQVKKMDVEPVLEGNQIEEKPIKQYPIAKIYEYNIPERKNTSFEIIDHTKSSKAAVQVKNYHQDYEIYYIQNANHHSWMVESDQYIFYINKQFGGSIYRLNKDTNENTVLAKGLQSLSGLSIFQDRLFFRAKIESIENHLYSIDYNGNNFKKETESLYSGIMNKDGVFYSTGYLNEEPNITIYHARTKQRNTIYIPYGTDEIQVLGDELWITPFIVLDGPGFYRYHMNTKELDFVSFSTGVFPSLILHNNQMYLEVNNMIANIDPNSMKFKIIYNESIAASWVKIIEDKIYFVGSYRFEELEARYVDAIFRMNLDGTNIEKIYEVNPYDENDMIRGMVYINHSLVVTSDLAGGPDARLKAINLDGAEVLYDFSEDVVDYSQAIHIDDSGFVFYQDGVLHTFKSILSMDKETMQKRGIEKEIIQKFADKIGDKLSLEERERMLKLLE